MKLFIRKCKSTALLFILLTTVFFTSCESSSNIMNFSKSVGKVKGVSFPVTQPMSLQDVIDKHQAPEVWLEFGLFQKVKVELPEKGKELVRKHWAARLKYVSELGSEPTQQTKYKAIMNLFPSAHEMAKNIERVEIQAHKGRRILHGEETREIIQTINELAAENFEQIRD